MIKPYKCEQIALGLFHSSFQTSGALRYAGYAESTVRKKGYAIIRRPEVRAAIKAIRLRILSPMAREVRQPIFGVIDKTALLREQQRIYDGFTQRQRIFIDNYMQRKFAKDCARIAGYSKKNLRQSGSQVLTNSKISRYLEINFEISTAEVLEQMASQVVRRRTLAMATIPKADRQLMERILAKIEHNRQA